MTGVKYRTLFVFTLVLSLFPCHVLSFAVSLSLAHSCSLSFTTTSSSNRGMSGVLSRSSFWDRCQLQTKDIKRQSQKKKIVIAKFQVVAVKCHQYPRMLCLYKKICVLLLHDGVKY